MIYSEEGHGTTIKMYLPPAADILPAVEATLAPTVEGGHETILVVEDSAAVRRVAVNILKGLGYQVREAEDGPSALATLREQGAIDLLFTDLIMPNGMDGQELLRQARALRPGLKALFTSGYSEQFIRGRGPTEAGVALLSKPYRTQKLAEAVRGALDARSS